MNPRARVAFNGRCVVIDEFARSGPGSRRAGVRNHGTFDRGSRLQGGRVATQLWASARPCRSRTTQPPKDDRRIVA